MSKGRSAQPNELRRRGLLTEKRPRSLHPLPGHLVLRVFGQPGCEFLAAVGMAIGQTSAPRGGLYQALRLDVADHFRPHLVARWSTALMTCFSTVLWAIPY